MFFQSIECCMYRYDISCWAHVFKVWNCETWLKFNLTKLTRNDINKAGRIKLYLIWSSDHSSSSSSESKPYLLLYTCAQSYILVQNLKYIKYINLLYLCVCVQSYKSQMTTRLASFQGEQTFFEGFQWLTLILWDIQKIGHLKNTLRHTTLW